VAKTSSDTGNPKIKTMPRFKRRKNTRTSDAASGQKILNETLLSHSFYSRWSILR
jgi:hypothetical protein